MNQDLVHIYLMPGMAANPSIFDNISLSQTQFKMHKLFWEIPLEDETLNDYALRMTKHIKHDNSVLLGVSFGGILVQEMSKHIRLRKLIIVSSVKTKHELPKRMKLLRATKAYKLAPTRLMSKLELLTKFAFGNTITKRLELYKRYLSVSDKGYLDWAIEQVVNWNQDDVIPEIIHIHGGNDAVFPLSNIKECITVKGGTHIMIINKYKWFNENLPRLILEVV